MHNTKSFILLVAAIALVVFPFISGSASAANDAKTNFKNFCVPCHGEKGIGDGPNSDNMDPAPRDFTDNVKEKYMVKRTNEELFKAISVGGREIEKSGLMPPFGNTLSEKEICEIVEYIKVFYKASIAKVSLGGKSDERPNVEVSAPAFEEPSRKQIIRGKRAFGKYGCSGCHKINGRGGVSGPELTGIGAKLKPEQIYQVTQNARSVKADSVMPVYGLDESKAAGITKYLMSLQ